MQHITMSIKDVATQSLKDALPYLGEIEPAVYQLPLDLLFGASIGQHTRHFVEFYQCLLDQTANPAQEGTVNYALRKRDLRIEEDPAFAAQTIASICARLEVLNEKLPCRLVCDEHMEQGSGMTIQSNVERELMYNIEHTIHHLAIIKIGLNAVAPQIALPEYFGVAPSTIRHKQDICVQ
jgi:hypothetical protein